MMQLSKPGVQFSCKLIRLPSTRQLSGLVRSESSSVGPSLGLRQQQQQQHCQWRIASNVLSHQLSERPSTFSTVCCLPATSHAVIVGRYVSTAAAAAAESVSPLQRSGRCSSPKHGKHCINSHLSLQSQSQLPFGAKSCPPKRVHFLASRKRAQLVGSTAAVATAAVCSQLLLLSEVKTVALFADQITTASRSPIQSSRRHCLTGLTRRPSCLHLRHFHSLTFTSRFHFPVHFTSPQSTSFSGTTNSILSTQFALPSLHNFHHFSYRTLSSKANQSQLTTTVTTKTMDHLTQSTKARSCSFFDSSSSSSASSDSEADGPASPSSSIPTSIDESPLSLQLPNLSESGHLAGSFAHQLPDLSKLKVAGGDEDTDFKSGSAGSDKSPAGKVHRIIVEGNIGSGKTTFLKIFAKNCRSMRHQPLIVPEPIDLWRDVGGANIFQLLADDPKRWSFAFQSYVQLTMIKIHEMQPEPGSHFKVMERSLFSARYCFVENLREKGLLSACEHFILDEWFKASQAAASVDLIIYLKSDPDVVFERIKARGRPEEAGITLEYLRALHELHEDWLVRGKYPLPAQVLTIDANTPLEQIVSVYEAKTDGILRKHTLSV